MNIIILGPPGSGKGTQAEFLAEKFNLSHIDIGLALRQTAKEKNALGKKVSRIINEKHKLVPDKIIFSVLRKEFNKVPHRRGIVLDGAPRRIDQIDEVENAFKKIGRKTNKVIYLKISPSESIKRISKRYQCSRCFARFVLGKDIKNSRYGCPVCAGKIQRRKDDTPAGIRKRLAIYRCETTPVIRYFRKKKMLLEINGEKKIGEIFKTLAKKLDGHH